MKRRCFLFVFCFLLLFSGCSKTAPEPEASAAAPTLSRAVATPSMTPEPVRPQLTLCESREQLADAFLALGEREGSSDFVSRGECRGDLVASTGEILYVLRDYEVDVCRMSETGVSRLSVLDVGYLWQEDNAEGLWHGSEKQCAALLCAENRLVVLSDLFDYSISSEGVDWLCTDSSRCTVDIYDISDPTAPRWMRGFSQSGSESACLLYEGRLCLVTDREIYEDDTLGEGTLPGYWLGSEWHELALNELYLCDRGSSSYLQFGVYELESVGEPQCRALIGCGGECLLCERGLYGLIAEEEGRAVYFLPVENGALAQPVCSFVSCGDCGVSKLTGAGDSLCVLQDGVLSTDAYFYRQRYDEGHILALRSEGQNVILSMLSAGGNLLTSWTLGYDYRCLSEEQGSLYIDAERGLIGLPAEDGYTLMAYKDESFSHLLDCYSSDFSGNRRATVWGDVLYISDMTRVFAVKLGSGKQLNVLHF